MLASIFALFLAIAPPTTDPAVATDPVGATDYSHALAQLDDTSLAAANSVDAEVIAALAEALAQMDGHVLALADDEDGRLSVVMARLNLARGYQKAGNTSAAERELDRLLRESLGAEIPAGRFGPDLNKLFKARKAALDAAGKASLTIVCHTPCEVVLGTSRVEPDAAIMSDLYTGSHVLRIRALDGSIEPLAQDVELSEPGAAVVVEFAKPASEPVPVPVPEPEPEPVPAPVIKAPPPPVVAPPPAKRILSRGIEIDGLVLGTGLIVAGGVMLAFDEHCINPDANPSSCSRTWESTVGGAVSLGLGGALWITSAVLLAIDERRVEHSKQRAARFELGRLRF
jgi:hypothetical protein